MLTFIISHFSYKFLFLWMLLEGEMGLSLAGVLAKEGHFQFSYVLLIAIIGVMISDTSLYLLGRYSKDNAQRILSKYSDILNKIENWISKYAIGIVIFERFMYGFHIPTIIMLGMSQYSFKKFLFLDLIGAILWSLVFSTIGYIFGKEVLHIISIVQHNLLIIIIILLFIFIYKKRKRGKV